MSRLTCIPALAQLNIWQYRDQAGLANDLGMLSRFGFCLQATAKAKFSHLGRYRRWSQLQTIAKFALKHDILCPIDKEMLTPTIMLYFYKLCFNEAP